MLIIVALVASVVNGEAGALTSAARPKHVVLIVADDLGYADLGYTGSEIATPNIDKLAAQGVKVANFYVQRACSPTRAALLTGRYNIRYGFQSGVLTDRNNYSLPLSETTLPQFVRKTVGADCHMVGKWHLGYHRWEHTPTFRGFDSYLGYYSGDEDYYTHVGDCGGFDLHDDERPNCGLNCSRHAWWAQGTYSTTLFTSRAVSIHTSTTVSAVPWRARARPRTGPPKTWAMVDDQPASWLVIPRCCIASAK